MHDFTATWHPALHFVGRHHPAAFRQQLLLAPSLRAPLRHGRLSGAAPPDRLAVYTVAVPPRHLVGHLLSWRAELPLPDFHRRTASPLSESPCLRSSVEPSPTGSRAAVAPPRFPSPVSSSSISKLLHAGRLEFLPRPVEPSRRLPAVSSARVELALPNPEPESTPRRTRAVPPPPC
jgi:hypothetical protein